MGRIPPALNSPSPTTLTSPAPDPDQPDIESLILKISRAHHQLMGLIQQEIDRVSEGSDLKLHPGMMQLFCVLAQEDGQTISQLAERLEMAKSSVTGAVRRMETAGLVSQSGDASDRRLRRITLTPRGRALKPACDGVRQAVGERLDQAFSPAEFRQLLSLLGRLSDAANENGFG